MMNKVFITLFLLAISALACLDASSPEDFLITSLPGFEGEWPTNFRQYSGYVTVDKQHGRNMFFWFAESQNNPSTDPVLLWFNGGPGCSSLIGLMREHGPIRASTNPEGGMQSNGWSLNRVANVLYIESPAGVGFSYSDVKEDYNTGNNKTAEDNYAFLRGWYEIFSNFSQNELWISGESYAGVYVPQLVDKILNGPDKLLRARLTGFMLGNPVIDCKDYGINVNPYPLQVELFYWHGLMSISSYEEWHEAKCSEPKNASSSNCEELYGSILDEIGNVDGDDLFTNDCTGNGTLDLLQTVPNCDNFNTISHRWINRADVQKAIHARPTVWEGCTQNINYKTINPDILTYLREFFVKASHLKILYFAGDVDIATVPFAFTQYCLHQLKRPITNKWRPYFIDGSRDIAGYVEVHDRYTYATIKGAGHEAATYQPASVFQLLSNFMASGSVPSNRPKRRAA